MAIKDTPTTNPYMWDDVRSYVLHESPLEGIELEDHLGYIMLESWFHTNPDLQYDGYWEDHLTSEIPRIKRRLRRWPTNL